jgi:ribosome-associated protein
MSNYTMAATAPDMQASTDDHVLGGIAPTPMAAKDFAIEAARILADTRCHQVAVLDVTGISPITDFLVVASGTSPRQMKSASEAAEEFGATVGYKTLSRVTDSAQWIVEDFVDVVIHVFSQDARYYYDLDNLWGDARRVAWERPEKDSAAARA